MMENTLAIKATSEKKSGDNLPITRFIFLDGLRGLAALYVVIYHIVAEADNLLPPALCWTVGWAKYGHFAVDVFIILSGYCLMLPVAKDAGKQMCGGVVNYLKRRARRILPPYYAALVLAVLLNSVQLHGLRPHLTRPDITFGNLLSHLLLVHNWTIWSNTLDAPLWSVATEWQIYFFFPFLLVPVWRRFGIVPATIAGFVVGLVPHFLLPTGHNFDIVAPWYLGLFALGMLGAVISLHTDDRYNHGRNFPVRLTLMLVLFGLVCLSLRLHPDNYIIPDILVGLLAVFLILLLSQSSASQKCSPWLTRLLGSLESRPVVFLGTISYSLYLTHMLAMLKVYPIINYLHLSGQQQFLFRLCVCLPWTVFFAHLFFLAFERPFLNTRKHETIRETAQDTIVSPAP